jgi:hypothetical protein
MRFLTRFTKFQVVMILIIAAIISLILSFISHLNTGDVNLFVWADGAFQNFGTEMLGALITFVIFGQLAESTVTISLQYASNKVELYNMRRSELSRGEIMGRLGTLPVRKLGSRFRIDYIATKNFVEQVDKAKEDESVKEILIHCTEEEFQQFELDNF